MLYAERRGHPPWPLHLIQYPRAGMGTRRWDAYSKATSFKEFRTLRVAYTYLNP